MSDLSLSLRPKRQEMVIPLVTKKRSVDRRRYIVREMTEAGDEDDGKVDKMC